MTKIPEKTNAFRIIFTKEKTVNFEGTISPEKGVFLSRNRAGFCSSRLGIYGLMRWAKPARYAMEPSHFGIRDNITGGALLYSVVT